MLVLNAKPYDDARPAARAWRSSGPADIGLSNRGGDENYLLLAAFPYDSVNTSYLYMPDPAQAGDTAWVAFPDARADGRAVLENTVLPIRATFALPASPVAAEEETTIPSRVTLAENYPNPFNPVTTIAYTLPRPMDVQLTVHDVLGRRVATIAEGRQPAGAHAMRLDASRWASGVYVYVLKTPDGTFSGKMLLLK